MNEWLMIAAMGSGLICFAIGGTGFRFVRFAILPLILAAVCYYAGVIYWKDLSMAACLGAALTFGYGEKVPYWRKCITFSGYSLATLWIGLTWWQLISPVLILLIFFLSNNRYTSSIFKWKICECFIGALIGAIIASLISK